MLSKSVRLFCAHCFQLSFAVLCSIMNLNALQNPVKNEMVFALHLDLSAMAVTIAVGSNLTSSSSQHGFAEVFCVTRIMHAVLLM